MPEVLRCLKVFDLLLGHSHSDWRYARLALSMSIELAASKRVVQPPIHQK